MHKVLALFFSLFFSASVSNAGCSSYKESFIINEINSWDNWIELYRNPKNPPPTNLSDWSVTVCESNDPTSCITQPFNYDFYTDGSFPVITFSNKFSIPANRSIEILVKDNTGNVVDYMNIQQGNNAISEVKQTEASQCGFSAAATPCKYFYSPNSGQRDVSRIPDGGCSLQEYTGRENTQYSCNSCNISPAMNTCWTEDFASNDISKNWTIIKQDNFTPSVINGKLMLTNNTQKISTGMTLGGQLPSGNNFIQIEFEQNAYGGNGADGVTLTLSDALVTPVAGAFGGSLGYAQKCQNGVAGCSSDCTTAGGCPGFAGGWLGIGIDEYGNFSNPTEGRSGGPGQRSDSVAIRGAQSSAYPYISGTAALNPSIDDSTAKNYLYRLSVNTYNAQTWVKVERNTGSGYATIINWADATQIASSPDNFRLSLTGSTGSNTNYHSVDNFILHAVDCGTIGQPIATPQSRFDAWDSFRSIADRNISTKLVAKDFNLTIGSFNSANTALENFNGTVCTRITNSTGSPLTDWKKLLFNNTSSVSTIFNVNRAVGGTDNAKVEIVWKKSVDESCPLLNETNSTSATDHFAVRPAAFELTAPDAVAGVDFNLLFRAPVYGSTAPSPGYNETAGSSFDVNVAEHNASCITGTFSPSPGAFSFVDGSKDVTTRYSEVGVLDINISDVNKPCSSRFTRIDCDDANVSDGTAFTADLLPIGLKQAQITVRPHHFDLNATLSNFDGKEFTYLSRDLNMSARLDLNATARNAQNEITRNYEGKCYAKDTNLTLQHSSVPSPLSQILYHETLSATDGNVSKASPVTLTFTPGIFTAGSAPLAVELNFDRSYYAPLNPFDFNLTGATMTDSDGVTGSNVPLGDTTFVYGRVHPYDITTTLSPINIPVDIEIYSTASTGTVAGMPRTTLNWYRNINHNFPSQGNILRGGFSAGTTGSLITPASAIEGGVQFVNVASTVDTTIHLDISSWLWYSLQHDYSYNGTCAEHPCFLYNYNGDLGGNTGVSTGTFRGSDFPMTPAKNTTKKGVKVFR